MKSVLLIAYHYPPVLMSSGLQRTLANSVYLPDFGWKPLVLSVDARAYPATDSGQLKDVPEGLTIRRALALDSSRHLAIRGRYLKWLALPDPWISWLPGGILAGLRLIRKARPSVIWSTYPIPTAHLIGLALHSITRLPWIADFRDPMIDGDHPHGAWKRALYKWIEKKTVSNCTYAVFTTPGTADLYRQRFPGEPAGKWQVIPNGYDENTFREVEGSVGSVAENCRQGPVTLLHSGIIYPMERNPAALFHAVAALKSSGELNNKRLRIVLRAPGHEERYRKLIATCNIADIVEIQPALSYREALAETFLADGLLVLQGRTCNRQIPAKLYECIRAGRPVLVLADSEGDTAQTARDAGLDAIAPLENSEAIARTLKVFVSDLEQGIARTVVEEKRYNYSRKAGVGTLAQLLTQASDKETTNAPRP